MSQALTSLVQHYGLFAILILMAAESCGLPFPSEVIMPFSGALVAAGHLTAVFRREPKEETSEA